MTNEGKKSRERRKKQILHFSGQKTCYVTFFNQSLVGLSRSWVQVQKRKEKKNWEKRQTNWRKKQNKWTNKGRKEWHCKLYITKAILWMKKYTEGVRKKWENIQFFILFHLKLFFLINFQNWTFCNFMQQK